MSILTICQIDAPRNREAVLTRLFLFGVDFDLSCFLSAMPSPSIKASDLRLLVLAPSEASKDDTNRSTAHLFLPFLTALTDVEPSADITTFAGYTTHPPLTIKNKYYASFITIWCDELINGSSEWSENMRSDEAKEVREVIGGIVLLLPYGTRSDVLDSYCGLLADVNTVRELIEDDTGRDIATVAVVQDTTLKATAQSNSTDLLSFTQKLEDTCLSDHGIFGWDIIHWQPNTEQSPSTNEFGEKTGMPRVVEVLEQTDWSTSVTAGQNDYELASVDDFLDDLDQPDVKPRVRPFKDPIASQSDEFQREIAGLHFALEDQSCKESGEPENGDELEVDQMMSLMSRAAEIREEGATMSKEERERFARKEVAKLMREMKLG